MSAIHRTLLVACLAAAAVGALALAGIPGPSVKASTIIRYRSIGPGGPAPITGDAKGLEIRLSDAVSGPAAQDLAPPATSATPLSDAEVAALFARLPAIDEQPQDHQDAALPPRSLPAPRSGVTRLDAWPPKAAADAPPTTGPAPLTVLRHAPEGDVPLAARVALTFSEPMVAVTSHAQAEKTLPAQLTPQPPGAWRWAGSQLLIFEGPDAGRLPMATRYDVEVPAGTRSATGGVLAGAHRFTFTTPPPSVVSMQPQGGPQALDPLVVLVFDQRIDAKAMLAHVRLEAGRQVTATRLIDVRVTEGDDATTARAMAGGVEHLDRVLAFRATRALPQDTDCRVVVEKGAPSAEGPLTTSADQAFDFKTHGPFKVIEHRCAWNNEPTCAPESPWLIRFSNPLDDDAFDAALVSMSPAVNDLNVQGTGDSIILSGAFAANAQYEVMLASGIKDAFGQTLGKEQRVTFRTGPATAQLRSMAGPFVVLDPGAKPSLRVFSAGLRTLKVALFTVDPERDWAAYHQALQQRRQTKDRRFVSPGKPAWSGTLSVAGGPDTLTETLVDLAPALPKGLGHVIAVIEPGEKTKELQDQVLVTWAQATRIGLSAFVDPDRMLAWASDLADGRPAAGVALTLGPPPVSSATSGDDGLAWLDLEAQPAQQITKGAAAMPPGALAAGKEQFARGNRYLLARRGDDVAFLPETTAGWGELTSWGRRSRDSSVAWHVFDDRGLYRPGESARIKGFVRRIGGGKTGSVAAKADAEVELVDATKGIDWLLNDSRGNEVAKGHADVSPLGGFDVRLDLPAGMNLGEAWLQLSLTGDVGATTSHQLNVQEFRRPEYEVTVSAGSGPFVVGTATTITASALYFAGGPLPDAAVHWTVTAQRGDFHPPGWDEFTFGEFMPWWRPWSEPGSARVYEHDGRTDAAGVHALGLEFLSCIPPRATSVTCEATVQDVNRQAWSASSVLLVHPSDAWVGLRAKAPFVERGKDFVLDVIATDRDGKALTGREVSLRAARQEGRWTPQGFKSDEKDVIETTLSVGDKPVSTSLALSRSGSWRITATVRDDAGRPNETTILAWVSGSEAIESRRVEQQQVELIPDRKEYQPGDVARVLVRAPFAPSEALLTLRRSGIVSERPLRLSETSTVIEIPLEEAWLPGVTAQVDLVGRQGSAKTSAPAFGSGSVELAISRRVRELTVAVKADESVLEPGGRTTLRLTVTDAKGAPATGEVAVIVADEAVLALAGYQMADPLQVFYPQRGADVMDHHLRSSIELSADSQAAARMAQAGGSALGNDPSFLMSGVATEESASRAMAPAPAEMAMMSKAAADTAPTSAPIALRKDMNALALFEPAVQLAPNGTASISLKLPDSLTRYRVMAVAVSGPKLFGRGESTVTARRGLMVRPSLPRFLNFGDRAELPVVLQNQTGAALDVQVALRASNATLTGASGYRVRVPADDRVELRFPATTVQAGTMRVQAVAVSGALSDAAELSLPVWTPATTEAFATYGTLDSGAVAQPIVPPAGVLPQFGELSLTTSSTALFELGDAALALWSYRFECSEQIASRLIGILAMRDAVGAFAQLPPKKELDAALMRDIEMLMRRQSWNGDVGLWRPADAESRQWPWVSVHASHALLLARAKGVAVPDEAVERATRMLRDIDSRIPKDYPDSCRRAIIAQALWVRNSAGDADPSRAERLFQEVPLEQHGLETLAFLLPVIDKGKATRGSAPDIITHLRNRAAEEAGTVSFTENYGDSDWLVMHSARRTDGIILDALLQVDPESDLVPKIVRSLLDHRVRGAWNNTQENAFILLALDRYFAVHEAAAPNFNATAWLGAQPLAVQDWRGRSTERRLVEVPMRQLLAGGAQDVVVAKEGSGRLYWRLGMTYAPSSLKLEPSQHGFVVERSYEGVDHATDAWRDDDGAWHVKAGTRVRSRVTMVATARRTHVALTDPLPAGVDVQNPGLAMTQDAPQESGGRAKMSPMWWWGPWYEHQNLRDDRAEAFSSMLQGGAWEYAWVGRATTPGRYVVPPAKAEEMYHPETFGRSASDVLIVE